MATTINIDSFDDINLRERTTLSSAVAASVTTISVRDSNDFATGDHIYIGNIGRDGCESASVAFVDDGTTITLSDALKLAHSASEPVVSVVGDQVRIYRAPYVEGVIPDDASFTVLGNVPIDCDRPSTYYRDTDGSNAYWYRASYASSTTTDETALLAAFRGDDFGHYASLSEIRREAGFSNAFNLRDSVIAQERSNAEAELNAVFATSYTTPFNPVPALIHSYTIQLAGAMLKDSQYHTTQTAADLAALRKLIATSVATPGSITDDDGQSLGTSTISSWPDDTAPRAFTMGQIF